MGSTEHAAPTFHMPLAAVRCGDRVRLRFQGLNVAYRYGDTWGTVTRDVYGHRAIFGSGIYRRPGRVTPTMLTVALDAIGGDERRVRLGEIGAVERDGVLIAERRQASVTAADQFPLVRVAS